MRSIESASRGPLAAKVDKLTLTLSPLGQSLSAARCKRTDHEECWSRWQTWNEIKHDVGANWLIYLSNAAGGGICRVEHEIVALEMVYRPLEFKGIGRSAGRELCPIRAGKVGSKTIDLLTSNLLKPEELLDRIDAGEAVDALRAPWWSPSTRYHVISPRRSGLGCGIHCPRPLAKPSRPGSRLKRLG